MGLNSANIALRHPSRPDLRPLAVEALVDTGAVTPRIPPQVAAQLQPGGTGHREVTLSATSPHAAGVGSGLSSGAANTRTAHPRSSPLIPSAPISADQRFVPSPRFASLPLCDFALNSAPSRSQTSAAPARSAARLSALGKRTPVMTAPLARNHTPGEFSARVITMLKTLNAKAQRRKDARVLPALSASRGPHRAVKSGKEKVKFWPSFATPTPPRSSVNPPKKLFAPVAELWDGQSLAMQEKVSAQSACPGYWRPPRFLVGGRHPDRAVGSKQLEMASGQPETRRTNPSGTKSEARSLPAAIRPPPSAFRPWTPDSRLLN